MARTKTKGFMFVLQFRAVEVGRESYLNIRPGENPVPLSLAVEIGIEHCPWCGVELASFYGDPEELLRDDLALP